MAKIYEGADPVRLSEANKLYLYQLLSEAIGIGKQTFMPRALEALEAAEITPETLGYADGQALFAALADFVQLTPFKGGRLYVALTRRTDFDEALEATQASTQPAGGKQGGKGKPWKRKKAVLKPQRPKLLEPKPEEAEAPSEEQTAASKPEENAGGETAHAEEDAVVPGDGNTVQVGTAAAMANAEAATSGPVASSPANEGSEQGATSVGVDEPAGQSIPANEKAEATEGASDTQAPVATAPAKASGLASLLEQIEAQTPKAESDASADDQNKSQVSAAKSSPAATDNASAATKPSVTPAQEPAAADVSTVASASTSAQVSATQAPAPATAPARPSILEQIAAQTPAPAKPAPAPAPVAQTPAPAAPASEPAATATQLRRSNAGLPTSFIDEVSPKAALMGMLTRMLPMDADILTILDEDWRVARATGTATGSRNLVTFPLRYLQEDGSAPVTVTIKRTTKATDARRWQLALVDGDDGTGRAHESVGLEGLPQEQGGCWAQLTPASHARGSAADPARSLAQFMELGTWEQALGTLATAAAPERWNYPGEGVGAKSRYGVLRDYLSATLARVRETGAMATAADGSFAAFDTGLLTPMDEKLYAVLTPTGTDIPWHLEGFATPGAGELGGRLTATFAELPDQASYLTSIDDLVLRAGAMVIPDYRSVLSDDLDRLPAGWLAEQLEVTSAAAAFQALAAAGAPAEHEGAKRSLAHAITDEPATFRRLCRALDDAIELSVRRARQSYRHVAPAYDAARNRMLLLLPLALVDEATADCALALELMPSGAYQAAAVVTLPAAYGAARPVSAQMPAWLTAEKALG